MSSLSSIIAGLGIFYSLLYLADALLRHFRPLAYMRTLRYLGIEVSLLQIRWTTDRLNQTMYRLATWSPGFLRVWFCAGALAATLLIPVSLVILVRTLTSQIWRDDAPETDRVVLQPILPGVNLPTSQMGYYFLSLLVCSVFHEFGHAISAVTESVRILGFGVLVLFFFPAGYVDLPSEQLLAKSWLQRLRIFSAGVWHNVMLAAGATALLSLLPLLFSPLYQYGGGLCVTDVLPDSPVRGPSGLKIGDQLLSFSGNPLRIQNDLKEAVLASLQPQAANLGYCLAEADLRRLADQGSGEDLCCRPSSSSSSSSLLCFSRGGDTSARHCYPPRPLVMAANHTHCSTSLSSASTTTTTSTCPPGSVCLQPVFPSDDPSGAAVADTNTTAAIVRLIQIRRRDEKDFLYVGNPALIYTTIAVSDYCPRQATLPLFSSPHLPDATARLCQYIVSFSGALAVLNVVPSYMLDGQHMARALLDAAVWGSWSGYRPLLHTLISVVGTTLVLANIGLGLVGLLQEGGGGTAPLVLLTNLLP